MHENYGHGLCQVEIHLPCRPWDVASYCDLLG